MKTVFVFGTFDHLHPGHLNFLTQAKALGDELIVSVAQDIVVGFLKHRSPIQTLQQRIDALQKVNGVSLVVPGDIELGTYTGFQALKPSIVAFGYDQSALAADFKRFQQVVGDETPTVVLKPYLQNTYKSSLLRESKAQSQMSKDNQRDNSTLAG